MIPSDSAPDAAGEAPVVSCLLVTADRPNLLKRALRCYQQQTYAPTELVVLDNGDERIEDVVASFDLPGTVRYLYVDRGPDLYIGGLRNRALEEATGEFVIPQWDDDDWSHPERIERQVQELQKGYDACTLQGTLMHVDSPDYFYHPFIGILPDGVPPTVMHRRDAGIRYPNILAFSSPTPCRKRSSGIWRTRFATTCLRRARPTNGVRYRSRSSYPP